MTAYITQEYDFYYAISKSIAPNDAKEFGVITSKRITDYQYLIETTHGKFVCESFENDTGDIFMKVYDFI